MGLAWGVMRVGQSEWGELLGGLFPYLCAHRIAVPHSFGPFPSGQSSTSCIDLAMTGMIKAMAMAKVQPQPRHGRDQGTMTKTGDLHGPTQTDKG